MTIIFYLLFRKQVTDQNVRFRPKYEGSTFFQAGIGGLAERCGSQSLSAVGREDLILATVITRFFPVGARDIFAPDVAPCGCGAGEVRGVDREHAKAEVWRTGQ